MKDLMNTNEVRMNHVELCELINKLRTEEGNRKELRQRDFIKKIRKEVETLKTLGLDGVRNFSQSYFEDSQGKKHETFLMNKNGALQMVLGESVYVRAKILEYIESLERKLKEQDIPSYQIEDRINRAKAWIKEEECRQQLYLENQELKQEVAELEEYKTFKSMLNNSIDSDMLLGQFGQFLKSNTNIKTGQKLIFKYCRENGLVKNEYGGTYATAFAVNNKWFKNVGEYITTRLGVKLVNKIMITKEGCLYLGKKLFNEYLENTLS